MAMLAIHSCGIHMGDYGRILDGPAAQMLTGFLGVSGVPGVGAPKSFHLYIARSS